MNNGKPVNARDLPIVKLVPRTKRNVSKKYHQRIEASIRAVGLIEPLVVFPLGERYEILDGSLRYQILLEMGVETVPCLIGSERESFTGNRMVNRLSASQEMRMLRKSLEELDEKTIANALGMAGIKHRLTQGLLKKLDRTVAKAFEAEKISKSCATELAHVKPDRQVEILNLRFIPELDPWRIAGGWTCCFHGGSCFAATISMKERACPRRCYTTCTISAATDSAV